MVVEKHRGTGMTETQRGRKTDYSQAISGTREPTVGTGHFMVHALGVPVGLPFFFLAIAFARAGRLGGHLWHLLYWRSGVPNIALGRQSLGGHTPADG